jgi:protein-disulfide isomerase
MTAAGWRTFPMRMLALAFGLVLIAVAPSRADDALSPAQAKEVEKIVHDYLLKHPEAIMDAIEAAEDKEKADKAAVAAGAIAARHAEIFDNPPSQIGGNPKGDVTLVEFFDYRCPYCKQVQPELETLMKSDPQLRIVYKEFPILGPASVFAAKMALASRAQGKYLAFHQAMMNTKGTIEDNVVLKVASSVGIDIAKAKADMDAPDNEDVIKRNFALADALDINGTPAFVVDGKLIPGAMSLDELKKLVAEARKDGHG